MLSTCIGWTRLPRELRYGSGWTSWRRMHGWAEAGFDQLHTAVLDRLSESGRLDWSRASLDPVSVQARRGTIGRDSQRLLSLWFNRWAPGMTPL